MTLWRPSTVQADMKEYLFQVHLGVADVLAYYQGRARHVRTEDQNGRILQFPMAKLQGYVTPDGISGSFRMRCDDEGRFVSMERIS